MVDMQESFRQSMTWVHTWFGLVFCWILYFMFVTGTLGYLDTEIDHWMQPELAEDAREAREYNTLEAVNASLDFLQKEASGADNWLILTPNVRQNPHLRVIWRLPEPEEATGADEAEETGETGETETDQSALRGNELINLSGNKLAEPRDTGGGQRLYRMHYNLHYFDRGAAYRFVGVVTMIMFIGIITGIVIHRRIFADMFTFRAGKAKRSWLDMHNLTSVSSLPFQLMITYSGLLFMIATWMPGIAFGSFGFDIGKAQEALGSIVPQAQYERSGVAAPLTAFDDMIAQAQNTWGVGEIRSVSIDFPGDENAHVTIGRRNGVSALNDSMVFSGTSGELIQENPAHPNAPIAFAATTVGLHEGLFAGPVVRILYIFSGLLGTLMIATGAIYFMAKRQKRAAEANHIGYKLVGTLNIGFIMGLPIGIAGYFIANRLLPIDMEHRAEWEVHMMFLLWSLFFVHPVFRKNKTIWREQAWCAAIAFWCIPIVNAATTDMNFIQSMHKGDWIMAGFDLAAIGIGVAFATVARVIPKPRVTMEQPANLNTERMA